jgi:hypothetical protein
LPETELERLKGAYLRALRQTPTEGDADFLSRASERFRIAEYLRREAIAMDGINDSIAAHCRFMADVIINNEYD